MFQKCGALWSCLFALQFSAIAFADTNQDFTRLTQYRHRVWRISEGWFDSNILDIAQGADGYIWIGTESGLQRFDGVRFSAWVVPSGQEPLHRVRFMMAGRNGAMWMESDRGLTVFKDGVLADVPLGGGSIQSFYEDPSGNVWVARAGLKSGQLPLCIVSAQPVKCYGPSDGLTISYATRVTGDRDGYLWIGSGLLVRWKPGVPQMEYFAEPLKAFGNSAGVPGLLALADGSLLAGLAAPGSSAGLQLLREGHWRSFATPGFDGAISGGRVLFQDREGAIWLAPYGPGLVRLKDGRADTFMRGDGLSGDRVKKIIQDTEGTVWVATDHGLDSFAKLPVTTYTTSEGAPFGGASSVATRLDGSVVAMSKPPFSVKEGKPTTLPGFEDFKIDGPIYSMLVDHAGNLWFAGNQLYLYRGGKPSIVNAPNGNERLKFGEIMPALIESPDHTLWALITGNKHRRLITVATDGMHEVSDLPNEDIAYCLAADHSGGLWTAGGSRRLGHFVNGSISTQTLADTTEDYATRDLFVDPANRVWVVSTEGLRIISEGVSHTLNVQNGLPCDFIDSAKMDGNETVWAAARCGLIQIDRVEWGKILDAPNAKINARLWGRREGWSVGYIDAASRITQTGDGRLWFAGPELQMIDPNATPTVTVLPPVHVERVIVDRSPLGLDRSLHIPPNPHEVEIDYTAPSFLDPLAVQFKYQLEGHDDSWQTPGARRQAFYSDLSPGHYRFHVVTDGGGDVTKQPGTAIEFTVAPELYQTWWFRAICAGAIALALWFAYRTRLARVTGLLRLRHQERLHERENIARELHDTFFQSVQSLFLRFHTAAKQLPEEEPTRLSLERVLDDSDRVMLQGRQVMLDLRAESSKTMTLAEALALTGEELRLANPCDFRVTVLGEPRTLLSLVFEEMRRFGQEALSNAFRHAQARLIEVEINYSRGEFKVRVRDDGIGIAAEVLNPGFRPGHWGLPGMRERGAKIGGQLEIWSRTGAGTEIELRVPAGAAYVTKSKNSILGWLLGSNFEAKRTRDAS